MFPRREHGSCRNGNKNPISAHRSGAARRAPSASRRTRPPRRDAAPGRAISSDFTGIEAALVRGPFHVQAEYARLSLDGPPGNPDFGGVYIQAGWFITGETRAYKAAKGVFGRTTPARDVNEGGYGAFEVAARYDVTDMGDASLGEMRATTLGMNWYPLDHVRVTANYVAAELDAPAFTETSDALQLRLQLDW